MRRAASARTGSRRRAAAAGNAPGAACQAYLTVFLALALPVILSMFLAMIEAARASSVRVRAECVTDIAMNSVLAEFHRELFEQYDMFFVDPSYGTGEYSLETAERHLKEYIDRNLAEGGSLLHFDGRSFRAMESVSAAITGTRRAADDGALAVREQVEAYMSADPAGAVIAGTLAKFNAYNGLAPDPEKWTAMWEENRRAIAELTTPEGLEQVDDPAETMNAFRLRPFLLQVRGGTAGLSAASVRLSDTLSHRSRIEGTGLTTPYAHGYPPADMLVLDQYIMEKCGNFRAQRADDAMKYQGEYILFGGASDTDNMEKMARRLVLVRNALNCAYIFTDGFKCAEADALAAGLAIILLQPELQPLFRTSILLAWAYLESVMDVRALMDGREVPLMKTSSTWKTSLAGIFSPGGGAVSDGGGFSYEDYLRIFLLMENGTRKTLRLMDMMENDIRMTDGNGRFRFDACFDTFRAGVEVRSRRGYSCEVLRTVTYD